MHRVFRAVRAGEGFSGGSVARRGGRGGVKDETLKNAMEPEITPEIRAKVVSELEKWEAANAAASPASAGN